ncbi:hypothetical protein LTR97_009390 [Elasticomyces elasticus]|uniref:Uncharacterized protein n=1 Tax=Elasticomyces elasticus TaxID=574655 RepID=A0AAN7ZXQ3_9PEZI|nr:hypothetical protein LTR97_009390 [Elasticomyces elasticus]
MAFSLIDDMQGALHALRKELYKQMISAEGRDFDDLVDRQAGMDVLLRTYMEALKQRKKQARHDTSRGTDQRTPSLPGCALLEKSPAELQKLIMEYVLDFTTPPASGMTVGNRNFDCFGLTVGYKNQVYILFMPLEAAHKVSAMRYPRVKFISVSSFCAPLQISRTLLAPALEAMLGRRTRQLAGSENQTYQNVPSYCTSGVSHRTRFWDNDFFFPNGSEDVTYFLKSNINRRTYIERFAMHNDCWPKANVDGEHTRPEDLFAIFEQLALGKGGRVFPVMVVCADRRSPRNDPLRRHLGVVSFDEVVSHRRSCVFIHRRPWLGAGSCNPAFPRPGFPGGATDPVADTPSDDLMHGLDEGEAEEHIYGHNNMRDRWTYIQYDASWAELYKEDVKVLLEENGEVEEIYEDTWVGHNLPGDFD